MGREEWRPEWFDYEKCFQNLLITTENFPEVKFNVVYDGERDNNFIFNYDANFHFIQAKNDYSSFQKTFEIIKNSDIAGDDLIYLLENDYLHVTDWVPKTIEFFKLNQNNYLSLYDHNDKYMDFNSDLVSKILVTSSHHFRTTPSTCGSFIAKKNVLMDDINVHQQLPSFSEIFSNQPVDHVKFLILNYFKNKKVYSPVPGLSTHCLNGLLSPTINWNSL